jgi:hypothetical protein
MITLVLSFLLRLPIERFDALDRMEPVVVEAADSPLLKLQKQRFNERLRGIQKWLRIDRIPNCDPLPLEPLLDLLSQLAADGAALEGTPAGRQRWYDFRVVAHRDLERLFQTLADLGTVRPQAVNLARAARIDAQIDLLTSFPTADSPLLHLKDIPASPHPKLDRGPWEPDFPPLLADAIKPDEKDTLLRKLQKARVRDRALYVVKMNSVISGGWWEGEDFLEFLKAQMQLGDNFAELVDRPADRVKALELRLAELKEFEKYIATLDERGRIDPQKLNIARAACLDAEIALYRLRAALKVEGNEPRVKAIDEKLIALLKDTPFVFQAIKPDEKDTPLRKLQKARVAERAIATVRQGEVIKCDAWNAVVFAEGRTLPVAFAENLAELVEKPADTIKCYEMRLEGMKAIEKFVGEQVEKGRARPSHGHLAKAACLDAEIALLKAQDAMKPEK